VKTPCTIFWDGNKNLNPKSHPSPPVPDIFPDTSMVLTF
jgi:hypothetical protein